MSLFSSILSHDGPARRATPQVTTDQKVDLYFASPDPTVLPRTIINDIPRLQVTQSIRFLYLLPQRALAAAKEGLMKKTTIGNRTYIDSFVYLANIPQDCLLQLHGLTA
jgi:hypothetical protein